MLSYTTRACPRHTTTHTHCTFCSKRRRSSSSLHRSGSHCESRLENFFFTPWKKSPPLELEKKQNAQDNPWRRVVLSLARQETPQQDAAEVNMEVVPKPQHFPAQDRPHLKTTRQPNLTERMDLDAASSSKSDSQRKCQLVDSDGFKQDKKSCKPSAPLIAPPISTANPFDILNSTAGISNESPSEPIPRRMPTITAYIKVVTNEDLKLVQDCTAGEVHFKYVRNGLRIRTMSATDHKAATSALQRKGVEFYTHNPHPGQKVKFILKGPPPNMTCEEVINGLLQKGVAISHCRQLKRTIVNLEKSVSPCPSPSG